MKLTKKSANKVLSLLSKLSDKEVAEAGSKASKTKKNKIDAERIREALEERLADNPQYLDTLSDDEYIDLMDALPEKERLKMLGDDYGVEIAESQEGMMTSMTPKEAANSLELFTGASEVSQYLNTLDAKGLKEFRENVNESDVDLYGPALDRLESTGPRVVKAEGGSMLVPPEREKYSKGQLVGKVWKALGKEATPKEIKKAEKAIKKPAKNKNYSDKAYVTREEFKLGEDTNRDIILKEDYPKGSQEFQNAFLQAWRKKARVFTHNGNQYKVDEASPEIKNKKSNNFNRKDYYKKEIAKFDIRDQYKQELLKRINKLEFINSTDPEGMQKEDFRREFKKHLLEKGNLMPGHTDLLLKSGNYEGTTPVEIGEDSLDAIDEYVAAVVEGNNKEQFLTDKDANILYAPLKIQKAEGGSMLVPPELQDTYDNIPEEEKEAAEKSQLPDAEMENNYLQFILDESLEEDDQDYLMGVLEQDERLSSIFDQVMDVAGEFSGEGEVDGPGTGVSDSIPARLSDGEFVFTRKATDQLGAEQLQTMMDDAERAYDGGLMKKAFGGIAYNPMGNGKMTNRITEDELTEEEIKRQMINSNRMPSVTPR